MHKNKIAYSKLDCIMWLKNPKYNPKTFQPIDKILFNNLALLTIKFLTAEEIYNINYDMYIVLELDKFFSEENNNIN